MNKRRLAVFAIVILAVSDAVVSSVRPPRPSGGPTTDKPPRKIPLPVICEPFRVEVTGCEGRWDIRYPDLPGRLAVAGRQNAVPNIHIPQNVQVLLIFKSADYIYGFALPAYNLKEIAVPDLEFTAGFRASDAGLHEFRGDELCGGPHSRLDGHLCVEPQDRFLEWYEKMSTDAD